MLQAQYEASLPSSIPHLGWEIHAASEYPNGLADVQHSIFAQKCWAAVVINANATSAWTAALADGDTSYDPTGAIGIYYASARFYQVTLLYIESLVRTARLFCLVHITDSVLAQLTSNLANPLASARSAALKSFVSSAGNPNAITLASRVPQALGVGFAYNIFDLRPIPNSAWSSAAPMEASLIYFVCLPAPLPKVKNC